MKRNGFNPKPPCETTRPVEGIGDAGIERAIKARPRRKTVLPTWSPDYE
ncbi:MAG: hypothetical protein GY926_13055 [bacterium]|nr:hypothetical protein [bacterium]